MLDLSIVIVNRNSARLLRDCLQSIRTHRWGCSIETIVVDNASSDDSVAMAQREFPNVTLLPLSDNIGFGPANNIALNRVQGRYILFLNPDTCLPNAGVDDLIAYLDTNPDTGIAGCKLVTPTGTIEDSYRTFPSLRIVLWNALLLDRVFSNSSLFNAYRLGATQPTHPIEVDWVTGACLLVRESLIRQLGGFDEDFFLYYEDVDLCYRARQLGVGVVYHPGIVIMHHKGGTGKWSPARYQFTHQSLYRFFEKHYGAARTHIARLLVRVGLLIRMILWGLRYLARREDEARLRLSGYLRTFLI